MVPPNGRRRPFKFFNLWLHHPEFGQILTTSWIESLVGWPMFMLFAKLKRLKGVLKQLNLTYYSNIGKRVAEARTCVQERLFSFPSDDLCN